MKEKGMMDGISDDGFEPIEICGELSLNNRFLFYTNYLQY